MHEAPAFLTSSHTRHVNPGSVHCTVSEAALGSDAPCLLTHGDHVKAFDTNPGETLSGQIRLPEGVETVQRQKTLGTERERVCVKER